MTDFVFDLVFVRLRYLVVLAIDATQIAVAKKDVAGAARAGERWLFAKVRRVRRNDRQLSRIAARQLIFQTIVTAIERTDGATFEQTLKPFDATPELARRQELKI